MKSSTFLTSALAMSVYARPNPQINVGVGAGVTLFVTVTVTKPVTYTVPVTVTKPAGACIPPSVTVAPVGQSTPSTPKPSSAAPQPSVTPPTTPSNGHITGTAEAYLAYGPNYQAVVLYHHNAARANHGAAPLVWDTACENNARITANTCNFAHYIPAGANQGQNLFTTSGAAFNVTAGITESWYKGEFNAMLPYFGAASIPDAVFHNVGHLTQVLWKGTTKVGCVSVDCGTKMKVNGVSSTLNKYTVCNYASPGNYAGQYALNVGMPISRTNLGRWSD